VIVRVPVRVEQVSAMDDRHRLTAPSSRPQTDIASERTESYRSDQRPHSGIHRL
jgi:hypothetical protein